MTLPFAQASKFSRMLCLYHWPCPDGVFAALAVHLWHKSNSAAPKLVEYRANTTWKPLSVEDLKLTGTELVYLVDFTGGQGFAVECSKQAGRCVVLDHHKTAQAELNSINPQEAPNLEINFDMNRCGAVIALDYFQPEITESQRKMFQYIQDADLWRWELPDSKAFHAGLASLGMEWNYENNPLVFDQLLALTPEQLIEQGRRELIKQEAIISDALSRSFQVQLGGVENASKSWGKALAVVVGDEASSLRSQLGNRLAEESQKKGLAAVGVVAYPVDDGTFKVSLRSLGEVETTQISVAYGGGGHRNASSFVMGSQSEFETWKIFDGIESSSNIYKIGE